MFTTVTPIVQMTALSSWKKVESLFKKFNRSPFKHNAVIHVKQGELDPVLKWCDEHCVGEWGWMDHTDLVMSYSGWWVFLFDDDQDFTMFLLRWN